MLRSGSSGGAEGVVVPEFGAFAHVTAPGAAHYRRVMGAFVQAKRRFVVHLRPEDVHDEVGGELSAITPALEQLREWGNLRADPDTSRVTSVEDFHRARFLYQLTPAGEAAEEALAAYDEALGRRGALQAVALTDIVTQLRALLLLADQADPDPAKVHLLLRLLVDRFTDLAGNARVFMASLQRTIDLHDADAEAFRAYKDRLIDYLERFIKDLVSTGAEIASLIGSIESHGVGRLLDLAAAREAEDAAPGTAGGSEDDPRAEEFRCGQLTWRERWHGFRGWFVSEQHHPSQARLLRAQARAAIPQLLHVVAVLNERRAGRSDRSADFRSLARWFAQAPDEADPHRLWRLAFGLSSARHLVGREPDAPTAPANTSWDEAPPVEISPRLRKTGSYERRGRPSRVVDRSEERRHLAERAERETAEVTAARAALVTSHPTRLSDLGELEPSAFRLFLALLGDGLAVLVPGRETVEVTTSDGSLAVRLTSLDDGRRAAVRTADGVLRGPDHLIEIVDLAVGDTEASA